MSGSPHTAYYRRVLLVSCLWLLYVVSPIDLLPDLFPGIGWVDDLLALGGVYWYLHRLRAQVRPHTSHGNFRTASDGARTSTNSEDAKQDAPDDADPVSREDSWQLLHLQPGASPEEIHAAYKRLLLQYHPDRVAHLGDEFQRLAHRKTLALNQAYAILTQKK